MTKLNHHNTRQLNRNQDIIAFRPQVIICKAPEDYFASASPYMAGPRRRLPV